MKIVKLHLLKVERLSTYLLSLKAGNVVQAFCCHGGIPPPWVCPLISAIDKIPVPLPRPVEQSSIAWELLWNDPIR